MNLFYFLSRAIKSLHENLKINLISIVTIALAILIFSSFLLIYTNVHAVIVRWSEKLQVVAYLGDNLSERDLSYIRQQIEMRDEVESINYISKDQALTRFQKSLKGQAGILDGLGDNPLPASLEIGLKPSYRDPQAIEKFAFSLEKYAAVEDVQFGQEWVERFSMFVSALKVVGFIIGGLLLIVAVFIVSNTIKLTVFSRKEELEIMRLVGATDNYIRAPFLIEGAIYGVIGSFTAVGFLYLFYLILENRLGISIGMLLGGFEFRFLSIGGFLVVIIGGMILGALGSLISVIQFMEEPKE